MWRCTIRYVINISKNTPYSPYPCSECLLLTITVAYTLVIQHTFPESLNRQIFNSSDILKCNSNDDYSFCYYLSSRITSCMVCSGSFVATSETQEVISAGLRMIQNLVGPSAFGGRGAAGPRHVMTDDCDAEGGAIGVVWPTARRLLCTFHLGQAAWRWLRHVASGVPEDTRQQRMQELMSLVFSRSPESLQRR